MIPTSCGRVSATISSATVPAEIVEVFATQRDAYQEIQLLEVIGGERHAILHAQSGDLHEVAGIPLRDGIYNLFAIEAGKVVRIDDFADRGAAFAAAGLDVS